LRDQRRTDLQKLRTIRRNGAWASSKHPHNNDDRREQEVLKEVMIEMIAIATTRK
jgi:hypothetical protein